MPAARQLLAGTIASALIALAVVFVFVLGSDSEEEGFAPERSGPGAPPRLFAPNSVWNRPLPADAPLDPASEELAAAFAAEIRRQQGLQIGPWIQTGEYSTPLYVVGPDQAPVPVTLEDRPEPSWVDLQKAFSAVPIPPDAEPAGGTDGHMTIYQPSTDRLWEFWQARREADGWHANWGGAMQEVSESPGYYTPNAWPGATTQWGSTATSLPVLAGTVLISELEHGRIDHALALNTPDARAGVFAWPAQRTDGTGGPELLPQGARLRIDPAVDLDHLALTPVGRMIAEAAQRYGMIIRDRTHHATGFMAEDPAPYRDDPYAALFQGRMPSEVLAKFPWDRLQVMRMNLCSTAPCSPPGQPG